MEFGETGKASLGFLGSFLSLGILMLGMILAGRLPEKPEVMINQTYSKDSSGYRK
jgi:hypothetical protein